MDSVFKGVSKLCRNAETFSPLESTSLMEPGIKSIVLGTPDSNGGIVEDSDEEFRYEDCLSDDDPSEIPVMNFESTSVVLRSLRMNVLKSPGTRWAEELIVDSGANASLVCERRLLSYETPLRSKIKGIDDALLLDAKGQGRLTIELIDGKIITIDNVLYVPDSKFNLISVDGITKSTDFKVLFGDNECRLIDPRNENNSHLLGYNKGGLYHIAGKCVMNEPSFTALATTTKYDADTEFKSGVDFENVTSKTKPSLRGNYTLFDAHCVLGHPSFKTLDMMVKRGQITPIKEDRFTMMSQIENCPECVITKLVRSSHNSTSDSNKALHPMEKLHADLSGPHEIRGRKVYFMAIKDEFSGYIYVEFISNKSQASTIRVLDNFLKTMRIRVPQYRTRSIRTDNGAEFYNKVWDEYLNEHQITREEIAPYSPQSNGFAESTNHQLKLRAKCLLLPTDTIHSNTLYDFAIVYAAYLINRTVNVRKGKTPFELIFHRIPNLKNLIRFGSDVIVKLPREYIVKSRSKIEAICGTFLGTATDSNCYQVWLKGDPKMRIMKSTDLRPLRTFNFLTHSFKAYCVAHKDPRASSDIEPDITAGFGGFEISSSGSGHSQGASSSVPPVKGIDAHNSIGEDAHTMKERAEDGERKNTLEPPIVRENNLEEYSNLEEEPEPGDESIDDDIEDQSTAGNSINRSEIELELNQPEVLANSGEEPVESDKPVSTTIREAPEVDPLGRTIDSTETDTTTKVGDTPHDPQSDSTSVKATPQEDPVVTQVKSETADIEMEIQDKTTTLTRLPERSTKVSKQRQRRRKKSVKTTKSKSRNNFSHKPLLVAVPDESNDIQMFDDAEMPFLITPIDEEEYQEMLNSIDYRLIHHVVPSRVQDQTRPEKSEALSTGIDQMSVDEVTPIEPTLSDAGELPSTWASDVDLRHEEVLGPADPISLGGPAENARRASSSRENTGGNIGLPPPAPQLGYADQFRDGANATIPPATDHNSHQQGLSGRDRDADIEAVAIRAAEQAIAMLEERYSTIGGRRVNQQENRLVPARANRMAVVPTVVRPQMTSRRSTPHVSSKRVYGTRRPGRRGVPEEHLPPSRGPKGLLPYHQQTAPAEPETKMLESAPQVRLLEYPEDGPIYGVVPLYELPGIDQSLYMALSRHDDEFETGRIEELYDSGGESYDQGEIPDHPFSDSEPESESPHAGEQYDGNSDDSEISSHISVLPDDSEGNSTNSTDPDSEEAIVGRSHQPNHPEPGTGNSNTPARTTETTADQRGDSSTTGGHLQRPEVKKVRKPLLANTRSSRGRERKITWKMKEILRQAGYDPDADTQDDNPDDSYDEPKFRALLAVSLMARRSQASEYFTGPEKDGWLQAAQKELNSFIQKGVFTEIDPSKVPKDKTIIPMKWVLTKKFDADGKFKSYKARMVCQGFRQKPGIDFDPTDISSSVARLETLRVFIAIAASLNLEIRQADVSTAFLNAKIQEDIIVRPAECVELLKGVRSGMLWKLKKTVYGLKQSNKQWVELVHRFMSSQGFQCNKYDENFYMKTVQGRYVFCLVYVDDILIATSKRIDCDRLLKAMNKDWEVKDLGPISRYLGMRFTQDSQHIYVDQAPYLEALLASMKMGECNSISTPMTEVPLPKEEDSSPLLNAQDQACYRSLVGRLLWACLCTRPDLQFAVSKLSAKVASPTESDMRLLKKCLRYIKGTLKYRLVFRKKTGINVNLIGFSDASHGNEEKRTSQDGYIFLWNGTPISWSSRRQKSVSISTHQAEVYGISETVREAIWLRRLLKDFASKVGSLPIYADNQAAISSAQSSGTHTASKHIDLRTKFNEEKVAKKLVKLLYVKSEDNVADVFTKPLGRIKFTKFRDLMLTEVPDEN